MTFPCRETARTPLARRASKPAKRPIVAASSTDCQAGVNRVTRLACESVFPTREPRSKLVGWAMPTARRRTSAAPSEFVASVAGTAHRPRSANLHGGRGRRDGMRSMPALRRSAWRRFRGGRCRAFGELLGSLPPACAMPGLPPPLPPTILAVSRIQLPACRPLPSKSREMPATSSTLPSSRLAKERPRWRSFAAIGR